MTGTRGKFTSALLAVGITADVRLQNSVANIKANPSAAPSQVDTSLEQLRASIGLLRATVGSGC